MAASDLAKLIQSQIVSTVGLDPSGYNEGTPTLVNTAIANAITQYILSNVSVSSTYSGMLPTTPPSPDPIVSDSHSVVGAMIPPSGSKFKDWVSSLVSGISNGFTIATGVAGVTALEPVFLSLADIDDASLQESMKSASEDNKDDPFLPVWEKVSQAIINAISSGTYETPSAGQNIVSGSTGTVTFVVNSIE